MEKTPVKKTSRVMAFFTKTIVLLGIITFAFYGGLYSASYSSQDSKEDVLATISNIITSTEDEPIIMIIPNYSLWEKAKYLVTSPPERRVIKIKTSAVTSMLFKNDNPSWMKANMTSAWTGTKNGADYAWDGTKNGAIYAWDGTKNGAIYAWTGTKNGVSSAWKWVTNSEEKEKRWFQFR